MPSFQDLGLPVPLCQSLRSAGLSEPFPIQTACIPDILDGHCVLGQAPTGSGKTFAFGLPLLARLSGAPSRPGHPRGLVLAPTRELALQIAERLDPLAASLGLRCLCVVGGVAVSRHRRSFAAPVDVLIATPGRTLDLQRQGILALDAVEISVLDEADLLVDHGFLRHVRKILRATPHSAQRILFSATLDGEIAGLVEEFLPEHHRHDAPVQVTDAPAMTHYALEVESPEERDRTLRAIAGRRGRTLIFLPTRARVRRLVEDLHAHGITAIAYEGSQTYRQRTEALDALRSGRSSVLVTTDISARGLDVPDVSLVVHAGPPRDPKAYVHRAGRTARAGASGTVVTLILPGEKNHAKEILREAGVRVQWRVITHRSTELITITGARPSRPSRPSRTREPQRRAHRCTHKRRSTGGRPRTGKDGHTAR